MYIQTFFESNFHILDYDHTNISAKKSELLLETIENEINSPPSIKNDTKIEELESMTTRFDSKRKTFNFPNVGYNSINRDHFKKAVHWTCVVISINENTFTAELYERNRNTTFEVAEFEKLEVSKSDLELLLEGAVFYWSVGFELRGGQISKRSLLRFKRSPMIPIKRFEDAIDTAAKRYDSIIWQ